MTTAVPLATVVSTSTLMKWSWTAAGAVEAAVTLTVQLLRSNEIVQTLEPSVRPTAAPPVTASNAVMLGEVENRTPAVPIVNVRTVSLAMKPWLPVRS